MSSAFLPGTSSACQSEFNLVSHILDRAILFLLDCEAHQSPIVRCVSWCEIPALLFRPDKPQNRDHDNHSYKSFRNPVISTGVKWGLTPPLSTYALVPSYLTWSCYGIFTGRNEVLATVIFLHLFVILFTGGST